MQTSLKSGICPELCPKKPKRLIFYSIYTVAGRAIGFAPEQPLHVVALAYPASGILKQLEYIVKLF
jgi:hypothetical protein